MKLVASNDGYVQERVNTFCKKVGIQPSKPRLVLVYTSDVKLVVPSSGCHKCELRDWNPNSWGV